MAVLSDGARRWELVNYVWRQRLNGTWYLADPSVTELGVGGTDTTTVFFRSGEAVLARSTASVINFR